MTDDELDIELLRGTLMLLDRCILPRPELYPNGTARRGPSAKGSDIARLLWQVGILIPENKRQRLSNLLSMVLSDRGREGFRFVEMYTRRDQIQALMEEMQIKLMAERGELRRVRLKDDSPV